MDNMHKMSEEDIKLKFITPQILSKGWSFDDISMEKKVKLTDGKINLQGNFVVRSKAKFADYMLYYNKATPIAIVEAKDRWVTSWKRASFFPILYSAMLQ